MKQVLTKNWLFLLTLLLAIAPVIYFSWFTDASTSLSRDQWHYLTMLTSYYDGTFSINTLFMKHGEHLQLGYNLWFLVNAIYLGLNTRLELFIGLFFLCCFVIVLYREYARSVSHMASPLSTQATFILLLVVVLSFNQAASFTYSLLAFGAFANALLMMLTLSLYDRVLQRDEINLYHIISFAGVFFLFGIAFAGGAWVFYDLAMIGILFCWMITNKPAKKKAIMLSIIMLFLSVIFFLIHHSGKGSAIDISNALPYLWENASQAFWYVSLLFANAVLDINVMHKIGMMGLSYAVGLIVLFLYLISPYVFFKTRMWKRTYIPLYLWGYIFLTVVALLVARFPTFGLSNAASPRYVTMLQIGIISSIWIYCYAIYQMKSKYIKKYSIWALMAIVLIPIYSAHLYIQYRRAPYIKITELNNVNIVLNEQFERRTIVCPHKNLCSAGVITLKAKKLNVFNP